jgi:hypothetical protein
MPQPPAAVPAASDPTAAAVALLPRQTAAALCVLLQLPAPDRGCTASGGQLQMPGARTRG